jgi:DNA-binding GntR family transcriptional regulator
MRGFHVLQATAKDPDDLSDMLKMLMAVAVRGAVVNGDRAWEAAVIGAHHLLCRAVEIDHEADLDQAHTDFWIAMASGCDNQRLLTSLASLLRAQALYHRISVRLARSETSSRTEVYGRIVQFAINRDAESAIALILDDIDSATAACRDYLLATAQPVSKRGRKSR